MTIPAWLSSAPLGKPVVPEVNWICEVSVGWTAARRRSSRSSSSRSPPASHSSQEGAPSASPIGTSRRTWSSPALAATVISQRLAPRFSGRTKQAAAFDLASTNSTSLAR